MERIGTNSTGAAASWVRFCIALLRNHVTIKWHPTRRGTEQPLHQVLHQAQDVRRTLSARGIASRKSYKSYPNTFAQTMNVWWSATTVINRSQVISSNSCPFIDQKKIPWHGRPWHFCKNEFSSFLDSAIIAFMAAAPRRRAACIDDSKTELWFGVHKKVSTFPNRRDTRLEERYKSSKSSKLERLSYLMLLGW